MKKVSDTVVLLLNSVGIFLLITVAIFYILVLRVYLWNGYELPYWKHPLKSEIPFFYHNQLIFFLAFLSKYVAIPLMVVLLGYIYFSGKVKLVQRNILMAIVTGLLLFVIMEYIDPFGVFDWWLD